MAKIIIIINQKLLNKGEKLHLFFFAKTINWFSFILQTLWQIYGVCLRQYFPGFYTGIFFIFCIETTGHTDKHTHLLNYIIPTRSVYIYTPAHCKWWGGILDSPCLSVQMSVRQSVRLSVRPSVAIYTTYTCVPTYRLFLCFCASTLI